MNLLPDGHIFTLFQLFLHSGTIHLKLVAPLAMYTLTRYHAFLARELTTASQELRWGDYQRGDRINWLPYR
jgi:hypothetical protein